jgi:hypothetical protein
MSEKQVDQGIGGWMEIALWGDVTLFVIMVGLSGPVSLGKGIRNNRVILVIKRVSERTIEKVRVKR